MATYDTELPFQHDQRAGPKTALVLVNLGTPDAPTPAAVRRYLAEFLSDTRVVELPKALWALILHGIILRVRPKKSAKKYASIWMPEGSPLAYWTQKQTQAMQARLPGITVRYAMRYGQPGITQVLSELKSQGHTRVAILPLYPQYCAATTATAFDQVYGWMQRQRYQPQLRTLRDYPADGGYIAALADSVRQHWQTHGRGQRLLMSFHGMPRRTLDLGDPYHCFCHQTARYLAQALDLTPADYQVTFQSRFGAASWLQPYTEPTLQAWAKQGVQHVDVICPGFTSDCIETLEEIEMEAKKAFLAAGGQRMNYIACLNDRPQWLDALEALSRGLLGDWVMSADARVDQAQDISAQRLALYQRAQQALDNGSQKS